MAYGLRVKNAAGDEIVSITDHLGRVIGTVTTGTSSGSVSNAALAEAGAEPFGITYSLSSDPYLVQPNVSFSGSTMSWSWTDPAEATSCMIIYGVA